jgi:hypothetical protein
MHGVLPADPQRSLGLADSEDSGMCVRGARVAAAPFTDSEDSRRSTWFSELARKLWPRKTAAALQHLVRFERHAKSAGSFERQCYRYAAGDDAPPAAFLIDLLRGAEGERVLDHLMRGSREPWWQRHQLARAALPAIEQLRQLQLPID